VTSKEKLRLVVEELSEQEAEATLHYIDQRRSGAPDALTEMLDNAPPDDEPTTPEEDAGAQEAREQYRRGEFIEAEQIKREMA
jgi:hypothetical protein